MKNIALVIKYEGSAYHGWQVQKNAVSVAATLEKAAAMVVGHPVHITGCGRTDAGVHARRYVANFRTASAIPVDRLPYALNTHLPEDIVVSDAFEVHEGFNAIGSCVKKEYTYLIYNSRIRDPFYVNRAWFYPKHLDEGVMQRAAQQFDIGKSIAQTFLQLMQRFHDFSFSGPSPIISRSAEYHGRWPKTCFSKKKPHQVGFLFICPYIKSRSAYSMWLLR